MSQYDAVSLHEFLSTTPESGLRKMLVDKVKMTDVHFNLMIKIVRACNAEQFAEHFDKKDMPKIRLGLAETKIKEKFWGDCMGLLLERGLLQPKTGGGEQKAVA